MKISSITQIDEFLDGKRREIITLTDTGEKERVYGYIFEWGTLIEERIYVVEENSPEYSDEFSEEECSSEYRLSKIPAQKPAWINLGIVFNPEIREYFEHHEFWINDMYDFMMMELPGGFTLNNHDGDIEDDDFESIDAVEIYTEDVLGQYFASGGICFTGEEAREVIWDEYVLIIPKVLEKMKTAAQRIKKDPGSLVLKLLGHPSSVVEDSLMPEDVDQLLPQNMDDESLGHFFDLSIQALKDFKVIAEREEKNNPLVFPPIFLSICIRIFKHLNKDQGGDVFHSMGNLIHFAPLAEYNYIMAIIREFFHRRNSLNYEKPSFDDILTKETQSYQNAHTFQQVLDFELEK